MSIWSTAEGGESRWTVSYLVLVLFRVEVEVLGLHVPFVVPPPVESQRLVDQEGVVHGRHEELLRGRQTFTLGRPDV